MRQVLKVCLAFLLITAQVFGQSATGTPASTKKKAAAKTSAVNTRLEQMEKAIDAQQQQIQQLREELKGRDSQVQQLQQQLTQTQASVAQAQQETQAVAAKSVAPEQLDAVKKDVADLKDNSAAAALSLQETQKKFKDSTESPTAIHYKGVNITPGGFIAAETVSRQRAVSGDINTPFTGIPYPGNDLSKVTENNFTARQSRVSLLAESKVGTAKLTGYWEADFLGTGVTSNNRQSNSYVLRQRILFGQAAFENGWSFTGGQQWSLATEDKKGIQNRQEVLPQTIDSQYQVGFSWARQYGFRVVKDFGGKFAIGASIEGPQATIGGRGFSSVSTANVGSASVSTTGNSSIFAPGSGGGLLNFVDTTGYPFNKSPDIIVKAAADPGFGHYEVFGIVSMFRNRVYPCGVVGTNANDTAPPSTTTTIACPIDGSLSPSSLGAFNDTRTGGGFGANLRVPIIPKKLDFAFQGLAGDGVGRYGSAQLADMTLRPDGTQALIRTAHGLGELEFHVTPKLDVYAYYGGEYAWRAGYLGYNSVSVVKTPAIPSNGTSPPIPATTTTTFKLNQIGGYGSPFANNSGCNTEPAPASVLSPAAGSCAGDTRYISEATLGFWHKVYQGPKGGLRWGIQYSYFSRLGWSGNNSAGGTSTAAGISPKAVDNMVWTSFRYYLP